MTNARTPDGHPDRRSFSTAGPSAVRPFVRYSPPAMKPVHLEDSMQYALLIYGRPETPSGPINEDIAAVLARPYVTG